MNKYKDLIEGDIVLAEQVPDLETLSKLSPEDYEKATSHGGLKELPPGLWKLSTLGGKPFNWAPADHVFQKEFALVDEKPKKKKEELPE